MRIQTARNKLACEENNEGNVSNFGNVENVGNNENDGNVSNTSNASKIGDADYDIKIQEFEHSLHIIKAKERQYYEKWYGFTTYVLFFFTFSVMGWLWEVGLHIVQTGDFVKRGVLYGPWLPIYGSGGVLVLLLLRKIFKNPIFTFFLTMVISSIMEYATSWFLEMRNGARWWDYSGYFMNVNGRICLQGAVVFGIGGCLVVYVIAPGLELLYKKINTNIKIAICVVLVSLILTDQIYSLKYPNMGKGVTATKRMETIKIEAQTE